MKASLESLLLPSSGGFDFAGDDSTPRRRLSHRTFQAYVDTAYVVHTRPAPIVLRIGHPSAVLQAWHRSAGVDESVFVTACNPFGQRAAAAVNDAAMIALSQYLYAGGYSSLKGLGQGDDGEWPPEPSLLVLGGNAALAFELCVRFEQNATVYIGPDGIPLIALHPELGLAAVR